MCTSMTAAVWTTESSSLRVCMHLSHVWDFVSGYWPNNIPAILQSVNSYILSQSSLRSQPIQQNNSHENIQPARTIPVAIMRERNGWLNRAKPNAYTYIPFQHWLSGWNCACSHTRTVYRALHDRQSEALQLPPDSVCTDNASASHRWTNLQKHSGTGHTL